MTKALAVQSPPVPFYLVPLRPKYLPQHIIFQHRQPTFLVRRDRPSFPTHIKRQTMSRCGIFSCLYFCKTQTKRQNILNRIAEGISGVKSDFNFFMNAILVYQSLLLHQHTHGTSIKIKQFWFVRVVPKYSTSIPHFRKRTTKKKRYFSSMFEYHQSSLYHQLTSTVLG
jgi:hypothetical protein